MSPAPRRLNRVATLLVALMAHTAAAGTSGVPVALPPGESAARWEHALALGGLVAGPRGQGQAIVLTDLGGQWRVHARGADGRWREATVRVPKNEQDREGIVWLAKSLLTAQDLGAGWGDLAAPGFVDDATPPGPEPDVPPRPRPTVATAARPSPSPVVAPPPAAPVLPPLPTPAPAPPRPPPPATPPPTPAAPVPTPETPRTIVPTPARPRSVAQPLALWGAVGGGVASRPGDTLGAQLRVSVGVRLIRRLDLGVRFTFAPPTALVSLGDNRSIADTDVGGELGLCFPGRTTPTIAAHAGAGLRAFYQDDALVTEAWTPTVGAMLRFELPVLRGVALSPWIDGLVDLRGTELRVGAQSTPMQPLVVSVGLSLTGRREFTNSSPPIPAR